MSNHQSSKENNSDTPINMQNCITPKSNTCDILEYTDPNILSLEHVE